MKSLGTMGILFWYNLRLLPWYLWPILALIAFFHAWMTSTQHVWVVGGGTTRLEGPSFLLWVVIGGIFFASSPGYAGSRSFEGGQIPDGEFLLSRPILRGTAYLPRMVLFFIIMLATPVLQVYVASAKPDLRVEFYNWADPAVIAGDKSFYREQFPGGTMIHQPDPSFQKGAYDSTFVIPSGALLVAWWNLIVAIFTGLALQMAMFSRSSARSPSKLPGMRFFGMLCLAYLFVSVLILVMFPQLGTHLTMFEHAFFLFAHHPALFALSTLAAFLFVQGIALIGIRRFDVI